MTIVEKALDYITNYDHNHLLVILFNQQGDHGYWNHSLAFIRNEVNNNPIMLILDAQKAREQKIYCYPQLGDNPYLGVTSDTDLIDKNCYKA
jgi:hypothetical protein